MEPNSIFQPAHVIWVSTTGQGGAEGSEGAPLGSIQEAVERAAPGTAIMVKAGTYTENVVFRGSGSDAAPIQLISADGRGAAKLRPADQNQDTLRIAAADNIIVDGFAIEGPEAAKKNAVHIHVNYDDFSTPDNILIRNNDITAHDGDGIKASKAEHVYVVNNHITGSTGAEEAIDFVGVHHGVIASNTIVDANMVGIIVKGGSYDVLIEKNHIDGAGSHGIGVGGNTEEPFFWPGFIGNYAYEAKDIRVIGNEVEGTAKQALRVIAAENVEVTGNWLHDTQHARLVSVSETSEGGFHEPAWDSLTVSFDNNALDKADWLSLTSAETSSRVGNNTTEGGPPAGWQGAGVGTAAKNENTVIGTEAADNLRGTSSTLR